MEKLELENFKYIPNLFLNFKKKVNETCLFQIWVKFSRFLRLGLFLWSTFLPFS